MDTPCLPRFSFFMKVDAQVVMRNPVSRYMAIEFQFAIPLSN